MSNILSFSNWASSNILNENVQRAKKYLDDLYKQEDQISSDDQIEQADDLIDALPEEPREGRSSLPSKEQATLIYNGIRELLKNNDGYVYAFFKFAIDHNIPVDAPEGQPSLTKLYSLIREYAGSLNQLPMSIEDYATSTELINGVDSFEALIDEFKKIETRKKHKWVIEGVNGTLRRSIKELSSYRVPEDLSQIPDKSELSPTVSGEATLIDRLYTAAEIIDRVDAEVGEFEDPATGKKTNQRKLILVKSNAFSNGLVYLKAIEDTAEGISNPSVLEKIEEIKKVSPEAALIYSADGYVVFSVRTEAAQKELCKIVSSIWCINYGMWNSYAGKSDALQYNIFNFNKNINDPMYLVGHTIGFDGKLRNNHDRNDKSILVSSNLKENLEQHGYPEKLISVVVNSISTESNNKHLVQSLGMNSSNLPKLMTDVIQAGNSNSGNDPGMIKLISEIAKKQISNNISNEEIISAYSKSGILSPVSAKLFNMILPNISDSEKTQIIEKNDDTIKSLKKIVDHLGPEYNEAASSAVDNAEAIKEIIISGDTF